MPFGLWTLGPKEPLLGWLGPAYPYRKGHFLHRLMHAHADLLAVDILNLTRKEAAALRPLATSLLQQLVMICARVWLVVL